MGGRGGTAFNQQSSFWEIYMDNIVNYGKHLNCKDCGLLMVLKKTVISEKILNRATRHSGIIYTRYYQCPNCGFIRQDNDSKISVFKNGKIRKDLLPQTTLLNLHLT